MSEIQSPPAILTAHPSLFNTLRSRWAGLDRLKRGLLLLVMLRWLLAGLFLLDALPLELRDPYHRFYLHHGGDQEQFMNMAEDIVSGRRNPSYLVGIGQALVMLPWVALFHPRNYYKLVPPLVIINGFIFAGLSVYCTGLLARRVTRDDRVGRWAAGVWAVLPLLFYLGVFWHFDAAVMRGSYVPMYAWLNGLSDGPAMLFFLLAITALARLLDQPEPPRFWQMAGVGALLSITILFRVHYAIAVAAVMGYVLAAYGPRHFGIACFAALIAYIPQGWYNQVVYGFPFTTGYFSKDVYNWGGVLKRPLSDYLAHLPFTRDNLAILWDYYIIRWPWLVVPLAAVLIAALVALVILWRRRGWKAVALLIGAPAAYLVPMAFAWPFRDAPLRLSMPVLPYVIMTSLYAAWLLWDQARAWANRAIVESE